VTGWPGAARDGRTKRVIIGCSVCYLIAGLSSFLRQQRDFSAKSNKAKMATNATGQTATVVAGNIVAQRMLKRRGASARNAAPSYNPEKAGSSQQPQAINSASVRFGLRQASAAGPLTPTALRHIFRTLLPPNASALPRDNLFRGLSLLGFLRDENDRRCGSHAGVQ
jgi:hypothetical protein